MATFSPGTWVSMDGVDGGFADAVVRISADDHISPVARPPEAPEGENWTADARLIAAAPELLAACEAYVAAEDCEDVLTAFAGMTRAKVLMVRAIAKAKGSAQ